MATQEHEQEGKMPLRILIVVALLASSAVLVASVTPFFGSAEWPKNQHLETDNEHVDPTGFEHARQWAQSGGEISDDDLAEEDEESVSGPARSQGLSLDTDAESGGENGFFLDGDNGDEPENVAENDVEGDGSQWEVIDDDELHEQDLEDDEFHNQFHAEESERAPKQTAKPVRSPSPTFATGPNEDKLWYEEDDDDEFGFGDVEDPNFASSQANTEPPREPEPTIIYEPTQQDPAARPGPVPSPFADRIQTPDADKTASGAHLPIVVLVHDRAQALRRLLESIEAAAGADLSLVSVYQDGADRAVELVVRDFFPARLVRLPARRPDDGAPILHSRLTHNYRFMMEHALATNPWARHVIVLEDDLVVAPDVLDFFSRAAEVMEADPTIICASGYNDNGFESNTADPHQMWRGEHFMALGWLLSREVYEEVQVAWNMDQVWDVPFAIRMSADVTPPYECIYPEVPRTKHVGDSSMRGALTTSAASQQNWFDLIHLHASEVGIPEHRMMEAAADEHETLMTQLIEEGRVVKCLWEMVAAEDKETLLFLFEATAARFSEDSAWDAVAEVFGMLGRGGGWDRLPRGIHRGVTKTRVRGNLVLFISSRSPYAKLPKLAALAPFPPPPTGREDLVSGDCRPPPGSAERMMSEWRVLDDDGRTCDEHCSAKGEACSLQSMWATALDSQCTALSQMLARGRGAGGDLACSGCEQGHGGIFAPTVDELGVCRLPSLVAMTCSRPNPLQPSTMVVCPCGT